MPYEIRLPPGLKQAGWKVKIFDREGPEEPHVTLLRKRRKWRLSLRTRTFLDEGDKWSQIVSEVREAVEKKEAWEELQAAWNRMHPHNPISSESNE